MQKKYDIIDRYQLATRKNEVTPDWVLDAKNLDPLVRDYRYCSTTSCSAKSRRLSASSRSTSW